MRDCAECWFREFFDVLCNNVISHSAFVMVKLYLCHLFEIAE